MRAWRQCQWRVRDDDRRVLADVQGQIAPQDQRVQTKTHGAQDQDSARKDGSTTSSGKTPRSVMVINSRMSEYFSLV
ncbi:hypothetical protein PU99_18105 [Pseudomonas putida]|nr:hypothetical protein PU99_18105 [Pseudomonas putida]